MKNFFLCALAIGSFSAMADANANSCVVELQYQGAVLGQNVFAYDDCRSALRECKKTEMTYERQNNLSELQCVRLSNAPAPMPPRSPLPPTPPMPAPPACDDDGRTTRPLPPRSTSPMISAVGRIEQVPFTLEGRTADEVFNSCWDFVEENGLRSVDELMVSVNGHKYVYLTTGGWWSNPQAICEVIDGQINEQTLSPIFERRAYATGKIEQVDFNFVASSEPALYNQCVEFVDANNLTSVDEVHTSVNGSRRERYTTGGWWNTPTAICDVVTSGL